MATSVFILGAGASHHAGVPLMKDFLAVARLLERKGGALSDEQAKAFQAVFRGISALQVVHSKSHLDIHNVESVFACFEMAATLGTPLDGLTGDELSDAMKAVIAATIAKTLRLPHLSSGDVEPPAGYQTLVAAIKRIMKASPGERVAILTFNYDVAMEYAMAAADVLPDYAVPTAGPAEPRAERWPLLKLHGSLNWGRCPSCNAVAAWPIRPNRVASRSPKEFITLDDFIRIMRPHTPMTHCGAETIDTTPIIVPPTWNKGEYHRQISTVWKRAAAELAEAENIFVFGYSYPDTDVFFRYLYGLGTISDRVLRRFWVFDISETTRTRLKSLLGLAAAASFDEYNLPFEVSKTSSTVENAFDSDRHRI